MGQYSLSTYRRDRQTGGLSISSGDSTAAELRLALTITLTLTDTGFAVLTLLLGYGRHSPDPNASIQIESPVLIECRSTWRVCVANSTFV